MDFFARQEQTRRTSRALVAMFLLAFVVVALATTLAVAIGLRLYSENNSLFLGTQNLDDWTATHLGLIAVIAAGTLGMMCLASFYRAATLGRGGGQVARMLGATQVTGDGSDPLQKRLINVVEEIALASGVPVPEIYVLEQEDGINAFASGLQHTNAAITVTRGALERLDRAELQGVIAHEFSHILNGDMRLNQQLIGLSFGILVLSLAGRWLLRSARFTRTRGKSSGAQTAALAIGVALVVIGGIGVLLSRLIKAAVSRQRESLADASAVQFTREPQGIAGALKKIAGYTGTLSSVETEEVSHMLFERGARSFSGWFATHPPILERIRALDPSFDPRDLPPPGMPLPDSGAAVSSAAPEIASLAPAAVPAGTTLLQRAGQMEQPDVGGALRAALPEEIHHAARSRDSSMLLVLALSLAADERTRERQLALLERQLGATRGALCRRLHDEVSALDAKLRLPVLELSLPALKQRPAEQIRYLLGLLERTAELESERSLFDYMLQRVLEGYLRALPGAGGEPRAGAAGKLDARTAVHTLLANVAAFGHSDAVVARNAYAAGLGALGWQADDAAPQFEPPSSARDLAKVDAALYALAAANPRDKQRILNGVLATIRADQQIAIEEVELFRAIAATLDCPLPPGFDL